jgi:hypothetical protein
VRYAITFLILAGGFVFGAIRLGRWGYLLLWPAASTLLVGLGYAGMGARVFGKRRDGGFAAWAWVVHFPYLLVTLGVWYLQRWLIPENPVDEVAPGVWVGRRPLCHEIPERCRWVVDLTAELWVARGVCGNGEGRRYLCRPVLDGHVADDRGFVEMVREVAGLEGDVYVHCAQGHGRSAALAAGLMIARGLAEDADDAERKMMRSRGKIWLNGVQRGLVRRVTPMLREGSGSSLSRSTSSGQAAPSPA